jgi:hypothetical protein
MVPSNTIRSEVMAIPLTGLGNHASSQTVFIARPSGAGIPTS